MGIWPDFTWGDVSVSIQPYYTGGHWWDGTKFQPLNNSHVMIAGQEYHVHVSQDCTLDWLGYHFDFKAIVDNMIVWEPTEPPPEDGTVVIPLTLLIPSIPEPPPLDDGLWPSISSWITEYWWVIAVGVVVLVIGTYAYVRYK